jgi:hypothetical protein
MNDPVEVESGKYTFFTDDSGILDCLRHGDPWPAFREQGAHFAGSTLALYHALVESRACETEQPVEEPNSVAHIKVDGTLARLLRRTIGERPLHDFPVEDQTALHHLANLIDCPQCQSPYEISGTCEWCGREWGKDCGD